YCSYCFFFSSRRRHTRLVSDWSSDVCSSDLGNLASDVKSFLLNRARSRIITSEARLPSRIIRRAVSRAPSMFGGSPSSIRRQVRSEERRVGKECRCRGWGGQ